MEKKKWYMQTFLSMRWRLIRDAEAVTIPGWEHLDLCVHGGRQGTPDGWTVTEGTTGCAIAFGDTKEQAIGHAKQALEARRREGVDAGIKQAREEYGTSPRYQQDSA